ncbi:MAG: type II toxin-antitoxin system death-on-curing family toxin [Phycisphaerae bacterium]|nr:type II toxin-antitoxin system death-on-curing family toxin [Phycisphaerae bacterium]
MHEMLLAEHGGAAGIRDQAALESALAAPQHHFRYGKPETCELAAVYAHAITRNHPFVDGNKRTAFLTAFTFLALNGLALNAPEHEVVVMVRGLASRTYSLEEFAEWLRRYSSPKDLPPNA